MNYKKMLNGYKSLPINIHDISSLSSLNIYTLSKLNYNLFELINSYEFINDYQIVENISITEKGIIINLDNLKKILCKYFGIANDNNIVSNLEKIESEINNNSLESISRLIDNAFKEYKLKRPISEKAKKSTREKARRKEFKQKTKRDIRNFKDMILNQEKYNKADERWFNEEKLNLYLAYQVMAYAEYCKRKKENKKFEFALNYLVDYIQSNVELISNDFSFNKIKRPNYHTNIKYNIKKIYNYVKNNYKQKKSNNNENTLSQKEKIEKYNYSFFEYDDIKSKEILKTILKLSEEKENTEELKELLRRKIELYISLNYNKIKVGTDTFDGYLGFLLDNGYVILDKLFDDIKQGKISNNNAIYIIKEEDFEKITKMSKTQTIEAIELGIINAKRIIHNGDFESRVKKNLKNYKKKTI